MRYLECTERFKHTDHEFVVCAYGDSPYIEECIKSLLSQNVLGTIIMVTSTPSDFLFELSNRYNIPLYINDKHLGIASDWNYALECSQKKLVTIAHQDDIYEEGYLENVLFSLNQAINPIIAFTDYGELRNDVRVKDNQLLSIKRKMLKPLRRRKNWSSVWWRRRILSMGNAISCPSVTYVMSEIPNDIFVSGFKSNIDWQAWEILSRKKGDFVYVSSEALMFHRIHNESTTSGLINDVGRGYEDFEMFNKFWPKPIAKLIARVYKTAEKSNSNS